MSYYITGDTHGSFEGLIAEYNSLHIDKNDTIIILGDAGINYYKGKRAELEKCSLVNSIACTLFLVHGNHEDNPEYMPSMKEKEWNGGMVFYEEKFPSILYAKDGEIYKLGNKTVTVLGGAYSVDKHYRLSRGWTWFDNEQMTEEVKHRCLTNLEAHNWDVDYIFSHTTPLNYMPVDQFLPGVDQSTVDKSMEIWLQDIYNKTNFLHWYAGHYHCERTVGRVTIMFNSVKLLKTD